MKLNPLIPGKISTFIRRTLHPTNKMFFLTGSVSPELFWALNDNLKTNGFRQIEVSALKPNSVGIILYFPPRFTANNIVFNQIRDIKASLHPQGQFYIVTTKSTGGMQFYKMTQEIFGADSTLPVEVGNGGLRLVSATKTNDDLPEPRNVKHQVSFNIFGQKFTFETTSSTFSNTELDEGAQTLLEASKDEISKSKSILDVGCGWGPIGLVAASINSHARVVLVDINPVCVKSTLHNRDLLKLDTKRVQVQQSVPTNLTFDLVLTNPPFHIDDQALIDLFTSVKKAMSPKATLLASVEKTYLSKFQKILTKVFGEVSVYKETAGKFVVFKARSKSVDQFLG